ncbi:BgTH12-02078 [Blumeria graminis f. sp. triticale]|uniref:non-specific serine/threonine protein kinase n=1 Tax=Blumeria graminis f. sp. triticale TaxID=1689686 RepID=A0A9W4GDS5_BLUGR|nr:BgTH12-02078 [Blumeria graminis f. sp. triticale]
MPARINSIKVRLDSQSISSKHLIPLINSILADETDIEIWKQLTDLVDSLEPIPPTVMDVRSAPFIDSRHIRCTAPLEGQDQFMESLKDELRTELAGTIFENVDGFYKKYFEGTTWANKCKDIAKRYVNRRDKVSFQFPTNPTEANVWEWIKAVQARFIEPYKPYKTSKEQKPIPLRAETFQTTGPGQINGGLAPRQIDIFLKSRHLPARTPHDWRDVLVIGELTTSPVGKWTDKFLQLSVYMREVFAAQPLRRFVHGFLMFGTQLQLWVYDRSGPYSSDFIEISNDELGIDSTIYQDKKKTIITVVDADTLKEKKLYLQPQPFIKQNAIVTRGTAIFLSLDKTLVVKISWRAVGRKSEAELLLKARGVRGLATLIGSSDTCKISELRSELTFTEGMKKDIHPPESKMTTACNSAQSGSLNSGESAELNGGVKRGSEFIDGDNKQEIRRSKRACVVNISRQAQLNAAIARIRKSVKSGASGSKTGAKNGSKTSEANANPAIEQAASETPTAQDNMATESSLDVGQGSNSSLGKRNRDTDDNNANTDVDMLPERDMKKLCITSNTGESDLEASAGPVTTQENDVPGASGEQALVDAEMKTSAPVPDVTNTDSPTIYRNRWKTVIASKPFGRAIDEDTTPLELICGLRDAIKGHKSLFMDSKILHRDISTNNIILTDPKLNDGCYGVLIDLDLAISMSDDSCSADAKLLTGTMEFIALGILDAHANPTGNGVVHSYRHDLESFFYVLISVCVRLGWPSKKSPFIGTLRKWYKGEIDDTYSAKHTAVCPANFKNKILNVFSPKFDCVKELASKLRIKLFQRNIDPCIETDPFPEDLYNSILKAFDEEIVKMKRGKNREYKDINDVLEE